jgi:dTDP-4-dehydrorhamnose reductase
LSTRIVIVGAGGRLGAALARQYAGNHQVTGFNHAQLDLLDRERIREVLNPLEFDVLINCAAQTNVDRCETERDEAFALNAEAPRVIAQICSEKGAQLIHISTDYVFDGEKAEPYTEDDPAHPISVYGESKREGERLVLAAGEQHLVARVSWVFGPDRPSFIDAVLQRAREQEDVAAIADKFAAPTYTKDVAMMLRPLFGEKRAGGLLHLVNDGGCSWQEYAQWALDCCHAEGIPMKGRTVGKLRLADMKNFVARRPIQTVLSTAKYAQIRGQKPPHWRDAVASYVRDHLRG